MKTIAQQLNIKEFPFEIKDKEGNEIYYETSDGSWSKNEYDKRGNQIYYEDSTGFWYKREYDKRGNEIYYEESTDFWYKREYDKRDNQIYYEDSEGEIRNYRPKAKPEYTMEELIEKLGEDFKLIK